MSQVVVTNDKLKDRRSKTRDEESKIQVDNLRKSWIKSDITTHDSKMRTVASIALAPIIAIFGALTAAVAIVIGGFSMVMKAVGNLLGSKN